MGLPREPCTQDAGRFGALRRDESAAGAVHRERVEWQVQPRLKLRAPERTIQELEREHELSQRLALKRR
jgi:hypothetical protein